MAACFHIPGVSCDNCRTAVQMEHRVIRGDYLLLSKKLLGDASVKLIVTDPPYGRIVQEGWDKDWTLHDQWAMTSEIERVLAPGGTAYVWGGIGKPKDRLFFKWLADVEERSGLTVWDVITWGKKRAYGKSDRLLFTREECAMLVKGSPSIFHVPYLDEKRGYEGFNPKYPAKSEYKRRTNVWSDITELLRGKIHPCEKPARLIEVLISMSSNEGDLVVDFFAGSGSTGLAAKNLNRSSLLFELSDCPMH